MSREAALAIALARLCRSNPPPRHLWMGLHTKFREPGLPPKYERRAITLSHMRRDGSWRAARLCDELEAAGKLPRDLWYAQEGWVRRWRRFSGEYEGWLYDGGGGSREERRRQAKRAKAKR